MKRVLALLLCLALLAGLLLAGVQRRQTLCGLARMQALLQPLGMRVRPLRCWRGFLVQSWVGAARLWRLLARASGGKRVAVFLPGLAE